MLDLLAEHEIDLVVLAQCMQILTSKFVYAYPDHRYYYSFLPTFVRWIPTARHRG